MTSDVSRSISMKLSAISKKRGVPYQNVLTEFLIERLLARLLSSKDLSSAFIFKGGYVGRRAYGSPRYTVDLDALLIDLSISALEEKLVSCIEKGTEDGTWYRFETKIDLQTQGEYPGIRFSFRAGLGEILPELQRAQIVNLDIGVGDAVEPINAKIEPLLDGELLSWAVYPREVIIAEKVHSFLSRPLENSRSKDLFDLMFHLLDCPPGKVKNAIEQTFIARGDELPSNVARAFRGLRTANLKKGWASAVSGIRDAGSFDETFTKVAAMLEEIYS